MLTKDQANTAADSLLQTHKLQSRWRLFRTDKSAPARNWAPLGMAAGAGVGMIISLFVPGHAAQDIGFGMCAGSLLGACLDKQVRPGFLMAVAGLLGIGGLLLWDLSRAF